MPSLTSHRLWGLDSRKWSTGWTELPLVPEPHALVQYIQHAQWHTVALDTVLGASIASILRGRKLSSKGARTLSQSYTEMIPTGDTQTHAPCHTEPPQKKVWPCSTEPPRTRRPCFLLALLVTLGTAAKANDKIRYL